MLDPDSSARICGPGLPANLPRADFLSTSAGSVGRGQTLQAFSTLRSTCFGECGPGTRWELRERPWFRLRFRVAVEVTVDEYPAILASDMMPSRRIMIQVRG